MADLKSAQRGTFAAAVTDTRLLLECPLLRRAFPSAEFPSADATADALIPVEAEFVANCNSKEGGWLLEGLVTVLTFVGRKQTQSASTLVCALFESCREDYGARATLEQVLMVWREWSGAPITTQGLRDRWLYRTG